VFSILIKPQRYRTCCTTVYSGAIWTFNNP